MSIIITTHVRIRFLQFSSQRVKTTFHKIAYIPEKTCGFLILQGESKVKEVSCAIAV